MNKPPFILCSLSALSIFCLADFSMTQPAGARQPKVSEYSGKTAVASATGQTTIAASSSQNILMQKSKDGQEFIEKLYQTADSLSSYSFHYKMTAFKGKNPESEEGYFYFKKPRLMRIELTGGSKKGSVAVLGMDGKVRGHMGGLLSPFKATLSPNSDMLRSVNGYPMVDSDLSSLMSYLKNMLKQGDKSQVTLVPVTIPGISKPVYVLDMYRQLATGKLVIKRIFVDPQNNLPLEWHDFVEGKLLSKSTWDNINTNANLSDSFFRI